VRESNKNENGKEKKEKKKKKRTTFQPFFSFKSPDYIPCGFLSFPDFIFPLHKKEAIAVEVFVCFCFCFCFFHNKMETAGLLQNVLYPAFVVVVSFAVVFAIIAFGQKLSEIHFGKTLTMC